MFGKVSRVGSVWILSLVAVVAIIAILVLPHRLIGSSLVVIDELPLDLGRLNEGDFSFSIVVENRGSKPARLLGMQASCRCIHIDGFPIVVPANTAIDIVATVNVAGKIDPGQVDFLIFMDSERQKHLLGKVVWDR